jgi:hypothetical protein
MEIRKQRSANRAPCVPEALGITGAHTTSDSAFTKRETKENDWTDEMPANLGP